MKTLTHCNGPLDHAGAASPPLSGAELRRQELAASIPLQSFDCSVSIGRLQEELRKQNGDVKAAIVRVTSELQKSLMKGLEELVNSLPEEARLAVDVYFTNVVGEVASNLIEYGLARIDGERTKDRPLSDKDLLNGAPLDDRQLGLNPDQINYYQDRLSRLDRIIGQAIHQIDPAMGVSCRMNVFPDRFEFRAKDPQGFPKFEEKLAHALDCAQDIWVNVNGGRGMCMLVMHCTDISRDPQDWSTIVFSKELSRPTIYERLYPEGGGD